MAVTPLFDDGYGVGGIGGWVTGGTDGGFGSVVTEGTCFSNTDTSGIVFNGNRAAIVRAGRDARPGSTGTLTSPIFNAGIGISFKALTERIDDRKIPAMPVNFAVHILAANGTSIKAVSIRTATIEVTSGCPGETVNEAFSSHFVDTRQFVGQPIRVQFRQSSKKIGAGFFTLFDEVIRFDTGDTQTLSNRPTAVAGVSESSAGRLRLDGSLSYDTAGLPLEFSWRVRGDVFEREGEFPCIDDLDPGRYQAALVVNNGLYIDADSVHFVITETVEASDDESEDEEEEEESEATKDGELTLDCSDGASASSGSMSLATSSENGSNSFRQEAPSLDGTGVTWEPASEVDGNLVILLPTDYGTPGARLFDSGGLFIDEGNYVGQTNGNRATYRFSRPGAELASPVFLQLGNDNYRVDNPALKNY
jgi:hypothetical protein